MPDVLMRAVATKKGNDRNVILMTPPDVDLSTFSFYKAIFLVKHFT